MFKLNLKNTIVTLLFFLLTYLNTTKIVMSEIIFPIFINTDEEKI